MVTLTPEGDLPGLLDGHDPADIERAALRLVAGGLVAFPTETVYGLGARADDDAAVAAIFAAKGRPADHPLIVHVASLAAAESFGDLSSDAARRLAARGWPGPLTLIVPRQPGRARAAAAGQPSIGLRWPAHPVAQALLERCAALGVWGLAGPSANRFGRVSPTCADHVRQEFADAVPVLDGGICRRGIESAIVDCTSPRPALLRPGVLSRRELEAIVGLALAAPDAASPKAPGTLLAHYAPNARLRLMDGDALRTALAILADGQVPAGLAVYSRSALRPPRGIDHRRMPDSAAAAAHELFGALRAFDDRGARLIWVETPPPDPAWDGVRDRLQRAAAAA